MAAKVAMMVSQVPEEREEFRLGSTHLPGSDPDWEGEKQGRGSHPRIGGVWEGGEKEGGRRHQTHRQSSCSGQAFIRAGGSPIAEIYPQGLFNFLGS